MSVPAEVEDLISGARLSAHVATSVDDRPHVAPVWYLYDESVLSFVTSGRKLENVRRNPRVAVSIERVTEGSVDWSVTLLGTASVVEDRERVAPVAERIFEKYDSDGEYPFQPLVEVEVGSASAQVY
ncbi:pyridoxamine 5'-phosphate oxidase family protein [Salinirubellus sp. GCM10025818]|uniref:pyridoxamine 5'-phosphate oxidase family protein n=1 Tax=Salinirubellus TaxID=2162630 RepID=UPI0030CEAE40